MNLLPLETFRRLLGYNPWHFWGFSSTTGATRVTSSCNQVLKQYSWQNTDAVGRVDILQAIEDAEQRLQSYLGYDVAPTYREETVLWPRYNDPSLLRRIPLDATSRWGSIKLPHGHVQAAGIEARTLISAAVAVAYSDLDGDGFYDTATISAVTSVTATDEIAVYFNTTDRYDSSAVSERWRIQPLTVTISGGTATIKGPAWIFVKPVKAEGASTVDLDPTDAANYASTVDIYRRYTNTEGATNSTAQAMLIWETRPCSGWWCGSCADATYDPADSSADPAARALAIARVGIRDAQTGLVTPAEAAYNTTSALWSAVRFDTGYEPDRVTVRYLAGYPLDSGQMDRRFQTIVARMALAELARPICACDKANRELYRWQFDLAQTSGNNDEAYGAISADDLNNPFGTRRGHVYAWKAIQTERNLRGFLL